MSGAVSTDRRWLMDGRSRIVDEQGAYVADAAGVVLVFDTPAEAEAWLEGFCGESGVPRGRCAGCMAGGSDGLAS